MKLPAHLQKYVVEQGEAKYSPLDHATWRYVLRQLRNFLKDNAHESYLTGLEQTGITIDRIPSIANISQHLEKFGWRAVPVSGFIPPAAFMELQALGVLPIASDMRSIEHLEYTPAPDIVHEAAGHAPLLCNREYAEYLAEYAQIARKAILNIEDLELYKAIRVLSDVKENPHSTPKEVSEAQSQLEKAVQNVGEPSEGALLGRMNWWTAEYGLIGTLENPKIFGAGLLSSVGESKWCLSDKVKKIPLTIDCINYSYDITEPQPQLFVAKDFTNLKNVLHELKEKMSFYVGGTAALNKATRAKTVNTVELDSGIQISGVLEQFFAVPNDQSVIKDHSSSEKVIYIRFAGPTQLSYKGHELLGHSKKRHAHGFSAPLGSFAGAQKPQIDQGVKLQFSSGIHLEGILKHVLEKDGKQLIWTFTNCTVQLKDKILFDPSWGEFDLIFGNKITSVFGGPADREAFGETDDFVVTKVPFRKPTPEQQKVFALYQEVSQLRDKYQKSTSEGWTDFEKTFTDMVEKTHKEHPQQWLAFLELYEITQKFPFVQTKLQEILKNISEQNLRVAPVIKDGLKLANNERT